MNLKHSPHLSAAASLQFHAQHNTEPEKRIRPVDFLKAAYGIRLCIKFQTPRQRRLPQDLEHCPHHHYTASSRLVLVMDSDFNRLSRLQRRNAQLESDDEEFPAPSTLSPIRVPLLAPRRAPRISHPLQHPHPRPPPTPSTGMPSSLPQHSLPLSAPASPPTPIPTPSPKPHQRIPIWDTRDEEEDSVLTHAKIRFRQMDPMARQKYLRDLLSMCDMQQLSFVHHFVSPRLKKDPFRILPTELCLEVSLLLTVSI